MRKGNDSTIANL